MARDVMGLAEGQALAHQIVGQFRGVEEAAGAGGAHAVGAEGQLFQHAGHEHQGGVHGAVGVEETFLVFLQVTVVGHGQALQP